MACPGTLAAQYRATQPCHAALFGSVPVMKLTFANLKGGVAKSTSSIYVALALARRGDTVLLVDADDTNRTCLKWKALAGDWPPTVHVPGWEVPDLARSVQAVEHLFDHTVIDTGPQKPAILKQALLVSQDMIIPVAPSPVELEQLPDTFALAAEVDAISPVFARVLLVKVRRGTRSAIEARDWLTTRSLPVMDAEVHHWEQYSLSYGTVPPDLAEYADVLAELNGGS